MDAWVSSGMLRRLGALTVAVHAWDMLMEVAIIFITSTIAWTKVNNREGTQLHPSTEIWIKDLLIIDPTHQNKTQFPPQSLSHHEPSISLLSFSIRGETD